MTRALSLLERAIEVDPAYALAHGNAAMCHHCLFLRAGFRKRTVGVHPPRRAAMLYGQDERPR